MQITLPGYKSTLIGLLLVLPVFWLTPRHALAVELRLVVLNSDALEIVRALGAAKAVVAIGNVIAKNPGFWGELAQRPIAGAWNNPSLERIAELRPDAVITYRRTPGPELEARLAPLGIAVWRFDFYHHDRFVEEVRELASRLKRRPQGETLVGWWQGLDAQIRTRLTQIEEAQRPLVYLEGYGSWRGSGPGSGIDAMLALAGGRNLLADAAIPYLEVAPEQVVARAPQWIVKTASVQECYTTDCRPQLEQVANELVRRPALAATPAVRNRQLAILAGDIGPGPRGIIAIMELARRFHPAAFADLDPQRWHADYLRRFLGLPFKGIYVWPEAKP